MKISIHLICALSLFVTNHAFANPTKITIAEYGEYLLYAPLYVAEAKGYFRARNIAPTIIPAGGDEKVFAALLSKEAQFGISDPTFTAISGQRGKPGLVVGAILHNVPARGITFDSKVPLGKLAAETLRGQTVATYPAPSTSFTLQKRMFLQAGLAPSIHEMTFGSLIPALKAGIVSIALENEPYASVAELQGANVVYDLVDQYPEFAFTGLTVLPEFAKSNPDLVERVVCALTDGARAIVRRDPDIQAILTKRFPEVPAAAIEAVMVKAVAGKTIRPTLEMSKQAWDEAIKVRREVKDLSADPEFEKYVDLQFAQKSCD